ncbi:FUSC family protein [Tunturiibacter gelidoferens]|uniref:Multidrug resistance protein MdtO n=1 Tax=Tunturiibacter lichenicola TaxID=2051959 RepID=A0A7Y9T4K3_9BACT|nr:FUSC family protein [Edaphobacter lichenicola]NYF53562.1 multidrug resistance protein MdtO [Edaphobacter lichenicola]
MSRYREAIIASTATIAAQGRRSYWIALWQIVRNELEPYPGRLDKTVQYTVATVIAAIVVLTFRLPSAVLGVYYPLLLMEDTPASSFRVAKKCGLFLFFAAIWVLCGAVFFLGSPMMHFLWVVCTLFLACWLIEAGEDHAAATSFGIYVATGISVLDAPISPDVRFENILYILLSLVMGIAIFLAVQYVMAGDEKQNGLERGIGTRLLILRNCLELISEGRTPGRLLRRQLRKYFMIGTGRIRKTLLGLDYTRRVRDEQSSAVGLIGNMIEFTYSLVETPGQPVPNQQARLRGVVNAIDQVRADYAARRAPEPIPLPAPQPGELRRSPVYRLEYSIAILTQVYSSYLIADRVPEEHPKPKGLIRPGSVTNPATLRFAMRASLAAIFCYVFYWAVDWPGLSVALTTCIVTGLSSAGASRQKQMLRFFGGAIGGVFAFVAQIFILPRVQSVGGFSLTLAGAIFCSAWVFLASPRIAYAGRQMALAYEAVHLTDPYYNVGLTQVRDRVFGVFLGLVAMWLIFDRLWSRPAAPTMTQLFDETLDCIAELPERGSVEAVPALTRLRETIDGNFDKIRDLADAVLLEFRRDRAHDLISRYRVRSWMPLIRSIFMLRLAIMRRCWVDEAGADDPRVAEAIATSTSVLQEIRGMATVDISKRPDPPLAARVVPIPKTTANEPAVVRIAASLATVSAYLREDVLLDLRGT